jgi:hypothetical protein
LVINAEAVPVSPVSFKPLQAVSRQTGEGSEVRRGVEQVQFPQRLALEGFKPAYRFAAKEPLGIGATEGPNHRSMLYR